MQGLDETGHGSTPAVHRWISGTLRCALRGPHWTPDDTPGQISP